MKSVKKLLNGYGYYIALLAAVALLATSAYIIRNGWGKSATQAPETPEQVMISHDETVQTLKIPSKLAWPVSSNEIITPNSPDEPIWSDSLQMYRTHEGVDIAAVLGEAVTASMRGSVVALYNDDFLGFTVELKHEGNIKTLYANLSNVNMVKLGQTVRQGEVIGAVGESSVIEGGMSPHLHFEAYENGAWLELPDL